MILLDLELVITTLELLTPYENCVQFYSYLAYPLESNSRLNTSNLLLVLIEHIRSH